MFTIPKFVARHAQPEIITNMRSTGKIFNNAADCIDPGFVVIKNDEFANRVLIREIFIGLSSCQNNCVGLAERMRSVSIDHGKL